ncbi:3-methyladenine DNA glycosylase [Rhodococcus rhodochrous]|nr:3-methyladenine DNA glycosylase [Rhodococcus rhodochrous]
MQSLRAGTVSTVLAPEQWLPRRERHRHRLTALLGPYLDRRARGATHPVIDFLFTYYSFTPSQLMRWHPGFGTTLAGSASAEYATLRGYRTTGTGVTVDPAHLARRRETVRYVTGLLAATASRPAHFGCFGLHEWAMLYRTRPEDVRHGAVPLRLGHTGTDAVVESLQLRCTHYDAYRFFTPDAGPLNIEPLTRDDQVRREQPGCLHAAMDLYKYCYKLTPLLDSDLTVDCFELAYAARELDMRASPYDLSEYGYPPVRIETPRGRAEYVREQTVLAERSTALRAALLDRCHRLLDADREHAGRR